MKIDSKTCKGCLRPITWSDKKYAYAKLKLFNFDPEAIKEMMPRHLKCAQKWLKDTKTLPTEEIK